MKTLRFSLHLVIVALLVLAFSSLASAQATRTWVSGVGDDANPCSRTAPCKTFPGAISKTAVGGEIDCLDPGGFGAVTITKSITINCDQVGGILSGPVNAIVINAAGGTVTIRAVDLQGAGSGINGVNIIAAAAVHLVDMNIYGFTQNGVNSSVGANLSLTMQNVNISECANGVVLNDNAGFLTNADLDRVSVWNTGIGVLAENGTRMQIHNSTIFGNSNGLQQANLNGNGSTVTVANTAFTNNGTAIQSVNGASIGLSGNVITGSVGAVFNLNGGTISSTGNDNFVFGNPGGTGLLSTATPKI